jgi:uncharacterized protein (TIGR02147 family)
MEKINIFQYTDFRAYLNDLFDLRKMRDPKFSHRFLAGRLGLANPSFILQVMKGRKNLSASTCFKLSEVLKHSPKEAEYFENMVGFLQAKNFKEKDRYYSRMLPLRRRFQEKPIEEWQYAYYSKWYNIVIRELVTQNGFDGNFKALAKRVSPPVTETQARNSVALLLKLGLIKKTGRKYRLSAPVISTKPEVNSLAVVNFHGEMARLAERALFNYTKDERSISSCTMNISDKSMKKIKEKIIDFKKELLAIAACDDEADRVWHMNLQLFPVSKPANHGEKS